MLSDIEVIASIARIKLSPTKDFYVREKVKKALPFFIRYVCDSQFADSCGRGVIRRVFGICGGS